MKEFLCCFFFCKICFKIQKSCQMNMFQNTNSYYRKTMPPSLHKQVSMYLILILSHFFSEIFEDKEKPVNAQSCPFLPIKYATHIKERYLVCMWYKILPLLCRQLCFSSNTLTHSIRLNSVHLHMYFYPIHCPQGSENPLKLSQVNQVF